MYDCQVTCRLSTPPVLEIQPIIMDYFHIIDTSVVVSLYLHGTIKQRTVLIHAEIQVLVAIEGTLAIWVGK